MALIEVSQLFQFAQMSFVRCAALSVGHCHCQRLSRGTTIAASLGWKHAVAGTRFYISGKDTIMSKSGHALYFEQGTFTFVTLNFGLGWDDVFYCLLFESNPYQTQLEYWISDWTPPKWENI